MDIPFLILSHFLPCLFHCPSHSGVWLLELGLLTGGSCFCQVGRTSEECVRCGVHSGGKLILLPPLCPHSFPWAVLSSIHTYLTAFKMLILLYGGKLPLWNESIPRYFLQKGIHSKEEKNVIFVVKYSGVHCMVRIGAFIQTNHDPKLALRDCFYCVPFQTGSAVDL